MPPLQFNAYCVIKFVMEVAINPLGHPEYNLSDNDLKFDCMAVKDIAKYPDIDWKHSATNNSQDSGIAERTVGTTKRSV